MVVEERILMSLRATSMSSWRCGPQVLPEVLTRFEPVVKSHSRSASRPRSPAKYFAIGASSPVTVARCAKILRSVVGSCDSDPCRRNASDPRLDHPVSGSDRS